MVNIGVIGIGSMGKNHARVCYSLENVNLLGLSDVNESIAKNFAKKYEAMAFTNYEKLLSLKDLEAVIISTPTATHYKIAKEAITAGKHVLIEKPICDSIENVKRLIHMAEENGVKLAIGHIERHNPVVRFAKDALEKKDFGELIAISSRRVSNFPGRIRDVGCILDIGIHDIDVMRYLVGKVSSVYASGGKFKSPSFEDHANILLNFDNGVTGMIEVNWLTPMKVRKLFLTCSERFVELDYINQEAIISYSKWMGIDEANLYHVPIEYRMDRVSLEKKEPLMNEIEDFVDSIERDREPLVTGKDGFEALRIAKAAERSHEKGEVVQL